MVSIIIVNYQSGELLRACLSSLKTFVKIPYEVIVVDNASKDDSLKNLPQAAGLKIIEANENLGFPRGCNLGAQSASGQIFHFLNPDTEVTENINECYQLALHETQQCIYVTAIKNTSQDTLRSSHPLPTLRNVFMLLFCRSRVDKWYVGASVAMSRRLFDRLGGWSNDYFMYMEDVDLFYKAKLAGVRTVETASLVVHHQGGSSRQVWSDRERLQRVEKSAFIFARKFGLTLDYFVFKHAAFFKIFWHDPSGSVQGLGLFWRELLRSSYQPAPLAKSTLPLKD